MREPMQKDRVALSHLANAASDKNPDSMQTDRKKKGACAKAPIGQNRADEKQGGETDKHHHGIGKLRERVCDRMKSGGPGHALVQSGRRFQKMNDGEKRRGNQSRNGWTRPTQ